MPQPNLRMLIRSLRTRAYEKLEIQKYAAFVGARKESSHRAVPSQQELDFRVESRRKIDADEADL